MRGSFFVVSGAALALSWSGPAFAHADGTKIVGYSGLDPSKTCNNCHSGGTVSKITFIGPTSLEPGATGNYSVVIANSSPTADVSGIDIAADNPQAQLNAAGGYDVLADGEVVHDTPAPFFNGQATFGFTLTAPSTPGTITVYADGMEANLLDDPTSGDLGTVGTMTVAVGTTVQQSGSGSSSMACSASPEAARHSALPFSCLAGLALGMALRLRRRRGPVA